MKHLILAIALFVAGCAHKESLVVPPDNSQGTQKAESPASGKSVEQSKQTIEIDAELLQPCEEFAPLLSKNPSPQEILAQKAKDVAVRNACAGRHQSLVKIVKDAFNIREK